MDELPTGAINGGRASQQSADLYASLITNIRLLPHPFTCLAHVAFKVAILIAYIVFPYILGAITGVFPDFILTFQLIGLLVVADFWVVKNWTASTLAGIRWYCDNSSPTTVFVHRTVKEEMMLHKPESQFFWMVMYLWPVPWVLNVFFRLSTINVPSLVVSLVVLAATSVNLYNCLKCSQEKRAKTSQLTGQLAQKFMAIVMMAQKPQPLFPQ